MQSHSLMPLVTAPGALKRAARQCMRRASSRGADGRSWRDYRADLAGNLSRLSARLKDGSWSPEVYRAVHYDFITGKSLAIILPTVEDRIVHRAIRNAVMPHLTPMLEPWVFGYVQGHSRLSALRTAVELQPPPWWVANIDVADVSGGISAPEARSLFASCLSDGSLLDLIERILVSLPSPMAIGSGLSPMLIHLRLAPVDRALLGLPAVRFADNYTILAGSGPEAERHYDVLEAALAAHRLAPAPSKSWVRQGVNPEDLFLLDA